MANREWAGEIRDRQFGPNDLVAAQDMIAVASLTNAMEATPIGDPPPNYNVRAVYDSRPVNAYDFNMSSNVLNPGATWQVLFTCPLGYRAVPLAYEVNYESPLSMPAYLSTVSLLLNGVALPYNGPIIIGNGTDHPIKCFYLVEENGTFGVSGVNTGSIGVVLSVDVNVYGNLIPVDDQQLPYAIANPISPLN